MSRCPSVRSSVAGACRGPRIPGRSAARSTVALVAARGAQCQPETPGAGDTPGEDGRLTVSGSPADGSCVDLLEPDCVAPSGEFRVGGVPCDDTVAVNDLVAIIAAWGACP